MHLKSAGFLYGKDFPHLDHIATISCFLSIPLLVTDDEVAELATTYYPNSKVITLSRTTFAEEILASYDLLFSALPKQILDPLFFFEEHRQRKKLLSFWVPHGNSDKDNLGALKEESLLALYGKQMQDRLKQKGITTSYTVKIGNLRHHFYTSHKAFFDKKCAPLLYCKEEKTTILYAPSWEEPNLETNLSFLVENLPSIYNLLIKLHPNTLQRGFFIPLKEKYHHKTNLLFLENLPLIYPLLSKTDIYIGDHSSIAYDFLSFQKPLFFLTQKRTPIHQAGKMVTLETLFSSLQEKDLYREARTALAHYAFDTNVDYTELPEQIYKTASTYVENELHFL